MFDWLKRLFGMDETGSKLFMEKSKPIESEPSKEEVEEVMKGKK